MFTLKLDRRDISIEIIPLLFCVGWVSQSSSFQYEIHFLECLITANCKCNDKKLEGKMKLQTGKEHWSVRFESHLKVLIN